MSIEVVTDDRQVRGMARRAGVWAPLSKAQREGTSTAVLHGLTLYGIFPDGAIAVVCSNPREVMTLMAGVGGAMGFRFEGVHRCGGGGLGRFFQEGCPNASERVPRKG